MSRRAVAQQENPNLAHPRLCRVWQYAISSSALGTGRIGSSKSSGPCYKHRQSWLSCAAWADSLRQYRRIRSCVQGQRTWGSIPSARRFRSCAARHRLGTAGILYCLQARALDRHLLAFSRCSGLEIVNTPSKQLPLFTLPHVNPQDYFERLIFDLISPTFWTVVFQTGIFWTKNVRRSRSGIKKNKCRWKKPQNAGKSLRKRSRHRLEMHYGCEVKSKADMTIAYVFLLIRHKLWLHRQYHKYWFEKNPWANYDIIGAFLNVRVFGLKTKTPAFNYLGLSSGGIIFIYWHNKNKKNCWYVWPSTINRYHNMNGTVFTWNGKCVPCTMKPRETQASFFRFTLLHKHIRYSTLALSFHNILAKTAALRINLNFDVSPISSQSHTHPSHSKTSRLLTSSLSLGVPVPRRTQCMRDT